MAAEQRDRGAVPITTAKGQMGRSFIKALVEYKPVAWEIWADNFEHLLVVRLDINMD